MLNSSFKPSVLSNKLLLGLLFCLVYQTGSAEESNAASWHQIEYVIFQQTTGDAKNLRHENTVYPKKSAKQYSHLVESGQPSSAFQFTRLSKGQMALQDAMQKLIWRRGIKVLDYGAWQQQLISERNYPPLEIAKHISGKTSLFGELQIKKSRFTHAEFSIFLADSLLFEYADIKTWFSTNQGRGSVFKLLLPLPDNLSTLPETGTQEIYFNVQHLQESRRIKQGEVHYLDHPTLGVLVTISDIDPPEYASLNNTVYR